jgi:FtsP/CotA-like multicopper oxidase with cupredoxin domain
VVQGNTPSTIRVVDKAGAEHPYHLHGEFFQVLERSSGEMIPGQMDTILLEADEEILIWTNFTNPGRWMSHCHILEHAERGLMHEFIVEE